MKRKLLALMLAGTLVLGQAPAVLAADGYEPQAGDYASEEMYEEDTEENFQEPEIEAEGDGASSYAEEPVAEDETAAEEADAAAEVVEIYDDVEEAEEVEEAADELGEEGAGDALFFDDSEFVTEESGALYAGTPTLSVDRDEVLINEDFKVTVTPSGNDFKAVELRFDEDDWWRGYYTPSGESWAFDESGVFCDEHVNYGGTGDFTLRARVSYDDWDDSWETDQREWIETNSVKIHFVTNGAVGEFTGSLDKTTVHRGEPIKVTYTKADNAGYYYLSIFHRNSDGSDGDGAGWHAKQDSAGTYTFDTYAFQPGEYNVYIEAAGEGYETYCVNPETPVLLTIEDPLSDKPVVSVAKTELDTCENTDFYAFAPGAQRIEFFYNFTNDYWWKDDFDGEFAENYHGYTRSGDYAVVAIAHYYETNEDGSPKHPGEDGIPEDDKTLMTEPVLVTVTASKGQTIDVRFPDSAPSYLTSGEAINFTVNKPKDATEFRVNAWYDPNEENVDSDLFHYETDENSFVVSISKEKLAAVPKGQPVKIEMNAYGPGYEEGHDYRELQIISKPSSSVKLELSQSTALVNENIEISVSASGSRKITGARIWRDEENNWLWGRIFQGRDLEPDGRLLVDPTWGSEGRHAIFAQVTFDESFDDWDGDWSNLENYEWVTSNVVVLTTTKKGTAGDFTMSVSNTTVKRGEPITVTFTAAANADEYWIDADIWNAEENDWWWHDRLVETSSPGKCTIFTSRMEPGVYRFYGYACGKGYERKEASNKPIEITITESSVKEGTVELRVDKTSADTCEEVTYSVFAPGAQWIEVHPDYDRNRGWRMDDGGEGVNRNFWYGEPGVYRIVAIAHYYEPDENGNPKGEETTVESEPLTVTVTSSKGKTLTIDSIDCPAYIRKGESLTITAKKPAEADAISANAWYDTDEEDVDTGLYDGETRKDTLVISIPASALEPIKNGSVVRVDLSAFAKGYTSGYCNLEVPVVAPDSSVKIDLDDTEIEVNTTMKMTVSTTSAKPIKAVRIRKDEDHNWLWDRIFTSEDLEDGALNVFVGYRKPGDHVVYAQVSFDEWDGDWDTRETLNWVTTEPKKFKVTQKGVAGDFTFSVDKEVIAEGDTINISYTESKDAALYWSEMEKWNEDSREWDWVDGICYLPKPGTASYPSPDDDRMEVGKYRIFGLANAPGYAAKEASNSPFFLSVISKDAANHAASIAGQLNGLPAKASLTDESLVKSLRTAYDALSEDQKKYIGADAYAKLTAAESSIAAEKKAQEDAKKAAEEAAKKAAEEAARKAAEEAAKKAEKKANTINVKVKAATVKASKKKISIPAKQVFTVTGAQGKVSYKKDSGAKALKISKTGKITVAKGTKKGTYKMKVTVTASGDASFKEGSKTVTVKVKVKK